MRESRLKLGAGYVALGVISLLFIIPFIWLIRSSLMDLSQIFVMPPEWIPHPFHWDNYKRALTSLPFGTYFVNTLVIVASVLIGTVLTSTISAFGFSRIRWKGRDAVFAVLLSSMMLPGAVTLIPSFLGWKELGFYDTYYPLIVPSFFGGGIFNIFCCGNSICRFRRTLTKRHLSTGRVTFKSIGASFCRSAAPQ